MKNYIVSEEELLKLLDDYKYYGDHAIYNLLKSKQPVELANDSIFYVDGSSSTCLGTLEKLSLKIPQKFHNKPFQLAIIVKDSKW